MAIMNETDTKRIAMILTECRLHVCEEVLGDRSEELLCGVALS